MTTEGWCLRRFTACSASSSTDFVKVSYAGYCNQHQVMGARYDADSSHTCPHPNMKSCHTRIPSSREAAPQLSELRSIECEKVKIAHHRRFHRKYQPHRFRRPTRGPYFGYRRQGVSTKHDISQVLLCSRGYSHFN